MSNKIKAKIDRIPEKGFTLAYATVDITTKNGYMSIKDFMVLENKQGELYVKGPQKAYPDPQDRKKMKYTLLVWVDDKELMQDITDTVLDAYHEAKKSGVQPRENYNKDRGGDRDRGRDDRRGGDDRRDDRRDDKRDDRRDDRGSSGGGDRRRETSDDDLPF